MKSSAGKIVMVLVGGIIVFSAGFMVRAFFDTAGEGAEEIVVILPESETADFADRYYNGEIVVRSKVSSEDSNIVDFSSTYFGDRKNELILLNKERCLTIEKIEDDQSVAEILNYLGNQEILNEPLLIEELQKNNSRGLVPQSICDGAEFVFASFFENDTLYVALWPKQYFGERFVFFQPIHQMVLGNTMFVPDINSGVSLVQFTAADAGRRLQGFYLLNHEILTADLVEHCTGGMEYSSSGFEPDSYDFSCAREFISNE